MNVTDVLGVLSLIIITISFLSYKIYKDKKGIVWTFVGLFFFISYIYFKLNAL